MIEFTHIIDFIFKHKDKYEELSDKDKETFFFIINRKLARGFPKHAQLFNDSYIDKASALDVWFYFFAKRGIIGVPDWYWYKQKKKKEKLPYTQEEIDFIKRYYGLNMSDIRFLITYFKEELDQQVKFFRKLSK